MPVPEQLPDDINALKKIIHNYQSEIKLFEEKIAWYKSRIFGRKSEKLSAEDVLQGRLFDEAEASAAEEIESKKEEKVITVSSYTRKKSGRKPLPAWLPRIDKIHDLPQEEKIGSDGQELVKIGEVISEKLDIIPPKFQVIRNIRYKYACPDQEPIDEDEEESGAVITAPLPPQIIPKGIATPGLAAYVITSKFCDALPFYRLSKIFARADIDLPRATMCQWPIMIHAHFCDFFDLMREELMRYPVIGIDETTVQVMDEPGRKNTDKSYMWVARGEGLDYQTILFEYYPSRSAKIALDHLKDYRGVIQSDGFASYDSFLNAEGIIHAGCWSHVRRKFYEAAKDSSYQSNSNTALDFIRKLYKVEEEAREDKILSEDIRKLRQEKSRPIIESFKRWLDDKVNHVAPKGMLGKAIKYAIDEWPKLLVYLQDGRIPIDNNLVENAIRPFVVGRKNWLFSGSPDGAKASAAFYSLIETAKVCGLEPYWYLRYLFERLPFAQGKDELRDLLPQRLDPAKIVKS